MLQVRNAKTPNHQTQKKSDIFTIVSLISHFYVPHSIFQFQADTKQLSNCNMLPNTRLTEHDLSDGLKLLILEEIFLQAKSGVLGHHLNYVL